MLGQCGAGALAREKPGTKSEISRQPRLPKFLRLASPHSAQVYALFTPRLCESLFFHSLEPTQSRVFAYFLCDTGTRRSSRRRVCGRFCITPRGPMEPVP